MSDPISSAGESARGGTLGGRIALRLAGRVHPAILERLAGSHDRPPWGYVRKADRQVDPSVQLELPGCHCVCRMSDPADLVGPKGSVR